MTNWKTQRPTLLLLGATLGCVGCALPALQVRGVDPLPAIQAPPRPPAAIAVVAAPAPAPQPEARRSSAAPGRSGGTVTRIDNGCSPSASDADVAWHIGQWALLRKVSVSDWSQATNLNATRVMTTSAKAGSDALTAAGSLGQLARLGALPNSAAAIELALRCEAARGPAVTTRFRLDDAELAAYGTARSSWITAAERHGEAIAALRKHWQKAYETALAQWHKERNGWERFVIWTRRQVGATLEHELVDAEMQSQFSSAEQHLRNVQAATPAIERVSADVAARVETDRPAVQRVTVRVAVRTKAAQEWAAQAAVRLEDATATPDWRKALEMALDAAFATTPPAPRGIRSSR